MVKPLINHFGPGNILTASMSTVHAITGSQEVLDRLPKAGAADLRKSRSVLDNIILTSTGAAKALALVIPEMEHIGFIAESVRVPISTGSLIILVLNIQENSERESVRRELLNDIYRQAAASDPDGYLRFSERQNVSGDIVGNLKHAAIIEGHEIHTRTAEIAIDLSRISGLDEHLRSSLTDHIMRVPVTQAVIYGWYDNELGSYTNMLGDLTALVADKMV